MPGGERDAGQRDVDRSAASDVLQERRPEAPFALLEQRLELAADQVAALAHERPLVGREARDGAQHLGERALAAESRDAHLFERFEVGGAQRWRRAPVNSAASPGVRS